MSAAILPLAVAEDRMLRVPAGHVVRTAYVPAHRIRLASDARMAVGDVEAAYRRRLQLGGDQPWPPPVGAWEADPDDGARQFVIHDGRHEYVAAVMLGYRTIFVAWVEEGR